MNIEDLAGKLDRMNATQIQAISNQAVLENEVKNISKTMERFAEILSKQVEIETEQKGLKDDINFAFESIRDIQEKGTKVCGHHNTQFAEYHAQCSTKSEYITTKIDDIEDKIKVRDARFMKIATVIASPIYLYIISKILNL